MMNANKNKGIAGWKRALDIALILLVMPVLMPLAAVIAIIIRRSSEGPLLFQQERVGFREQRFMCLKFRTMYCGAETVSHQGHLHQLINSDAPRSE